MEDARRLSLWEYTALVAGWNKDVEAEKAGPSATHGATPTPDQVQRNFDRIPAAAFGRA